MIKSFVGRHQEFGLLDSLWEKDEATLLILYGRRRIGKTRLLTQWLQERGHRTLYWVAEPSSAYDQLRSFSQALYDFVHPRAPAPDTFTYATWAQAWQQVADLSREGRLALFIDEFTYLLEADASVVGKLQNAWDHILRDADLFLALSGSHMGMMQRQVLAYQAPLYGRATVQLHLQPLPFGATSSYFPSYTSEERVALYAMFGGVPAYWERVDSSLSISENIRRQLLTPNNLMQAEPRLLLQDFLADPHNYVGILRAIAHGARTQKEISVRTGLATSHTSKYLSVLREAGFVERRIPVTAAASSRQGRYHIADPYLRFYYRFLATRQAQLALGVQEQALAEIQRHFLDFIGTHTWEELCREWVLRASAYGDLPFLADQVGSLWNKHAQIDVAGINTMEKTLILGECKWSPKRQGQAVMQKLVTRVDHVVPKQGQWRLLFLGFARGGWTTASRAYAQEIVDARLTGDNWTTENMILLDLDRIDKDLTRWQQVDANV